MSLCDINPFTDSRWEAFLRTSRAATVFHSTEWMSVIRDTYGYECRVLATRGRGNELTAGLPFCLVDSCLTGRRLVALPFSDYCAPLGDSPSDVVRVCAGMKRIAAMTLSARIDIRGGDGLDCGRLSGLRPADQFLRHEIDLRGGIGAVEERFHHDCVRRRVRKAVREGIRIVSGTDSPLVDDFYHLMVITRRRHGYPPPPKVWFANLARAVPCLEFLIAYRRGVAVAGIVTVRFNNIAYYKYGASDAEGNRWGAVPLLYREMIRKAVSSGADFVDLGRTEPSNKGLAEFKERFGAVASSVQYWRSGGAERTQSAVSRAIGRAGRFLCSRTPLVLLPRIGTVLYPHAG